MKKRLVNPTDDDLNAAFAEYVAGLEAFPTSTGGWVCYERRGDWKIMIPMLDYSKSVNAVLPWLEKQPYPDIGRVANGDWKVTFYLNMDSGGDEKTVYAIDESLPRAIVIALLRAHNVEVEIP